MKDNHWLLTGFIYWFVNAPELRSLNETALEAIKAMTVEV
jgi:hypothetical protein